MNIEQFHIDALSAAVLALESVATGKAYDIDDLIAGKMALEQLSMVEPVKPRATRLLSRLAPFVTVVGYASSAQGQHDATRLLAAMRADSFSLQSV